MKKYITILLLMFSVFSYAGEKEFEISDFTKITATGNFKITLVKGTETKVTAINRDENIEDDQLFAEVQGTELVLKLMKDTYKVRKVEYIVYYKEVFELHAKRGAWFKSDDVFTNKSIDLNVDSGGGINIKIACNTVDVVLKNGGTVNLSGTSENANFSINKGGNIAAYNLVSENSNSKVVFGGEILVKVTKKLFAVVKSGGTIKYKGGATDVTEEIKLAGNIIKLDK